jgi:HAMP domain-containing protein
MAGSNRFFLLKILDVLTKRIKSKVIFFEILLILIVALSTGLISSFYMANALTEKAHQFSRRITKDLAKSVENSYYISQSAVDDAVQSFQGTEGIMYLGYFGKIVSSSSQQYIHKRAKSKKNKTGEDNSDVSRVYLFMGEKLSPDDMNALEDRIKGVSEFQISENLVDFKVSNKVIPCFEYYMPVTVKAADNSKKIGMIVLRYSQLVIRQEIQNIWILNAIITGYIIILGIYISIRGANTIVKPIVQLTEVVQQFGEGNLNVRANLPLNDEIGVLARTFDNMIVSVKEKLEMQKFVSGSKIGRAHV